MAKEEVTEVSYGNEPPRMIDGKLYIFGIGKYKGQWLILADPVGGEGKRLFVTPEGVRKARMNAEPASKASSSGGN
jgi:hypothetical protein